MSRVDLRKCLFSEGYKPVERSCQRHSHNCQYDKEQSTSISRAQDKLLHGNVQFS